MAAEAAREPIVEDIIDIFVCMVVLIAGCWVELQVLAGGGSRVVLLVLEVDESPAA